MSLGTVTEDLDFSSLEIDVPVSNGSETGSTSFSSPCSFISDVLDCIPPTDRNLVNSLSISRQLTALKNSMSDELESCFMTNNRSNFDNSADDSTLLKSCRSRWASSSRRATTFAPASSGAGNAFDGHHELHSEESNVEHLGQSTNDAASDKTRRISNLSEPQCKRNTTQGDESSSGTAGESDGSTIVSDNSNSVELTLSAWLSLLKDFTREYWLTVKSAACDLSSFCNGSHSHSLLNLNRSRRGIHDDDRDHK
jgi:hypothetical protein